ncbi:hypothetical protein D3C71_1505710 [compost metagenome]
MEFDVTNVIKDWHNQNEENYGFEIRSIDESTGNYLRFSSRESRFNEPELVVYYQDLTINSFGKSDIDSSLYVLNRNDLISSIRIPSYLSGEYLKSKLFVNRMDTKVSTLTISRPSIKSQLTARMNDERGIDATIDVRVKQLDEINTKLNISRPLIDSNVYVRFINEINSNVVIKKIEEKSITSSINVSRNNLNGFVSIPTIEYLDSNITIQGIEIKDISSKLFVSRNNILIDMYVRPFEDLLSNIDIQRKDSDTKKSFISISRK